jgi:hypothetical protein
MNPATENALRELLEKINNGIDQTVTFGSEQLPDVIQQLLIWNAVEGLIYSFIGLVLLIIAFWGGWHFGWRKVHSPESTKDHPYFIETWIRDSDGYMSEVSILVGALQLMLTVVGTAFLSNIVIPLQIWMAPKLFLLEYAAGLAK